MRIWLHTSSRSMALGPSGAISVVAHAALIGGAVYGTGRASRELEQAVAERIYYLPPPDRAPNGTLRLTERVRYIAPGAGELQPATDREGKVIAGGGGLAEHRVPAQEAADSVSQAAMPAIDAVRDSVYSILSVEESASRVEGSAAPIYPPRMLDEHAEGSVRARFVIDSTGHTDPLTIEVISATNADFAQSVKDAIPQMRFNAAVAGGRRVRQLVEQSFLFHIAAPPPPVAEHTRAIPVP